MVPRGVVGWTHEEFAAAPEVVRRLHTRILDLEDQVDRYREALEKIAKLDLPYRDTANRARHLARKALDA